MKRHEIMNDELIYRLLRRMIFFMGHIPVPVADFFAAVLGRLWFRVDKRHREITLDNLTHAFGREWPKDKIERTARQTFVNIAAMLFEVAWSTRLSKSRFLSHFTIEGLTHVTAAHARGKGVLVISCHMGNFEMLIPAIEGTGFKGYAIYRKLDFAPLEKLMRQLRERFGVTMIPMRGASRKLEEILAQGGGDAHRSERGLVQRGVCRFFRAPCLHQQRSGQTGHENRVPGGAVVYHPPRTPLCHPLSA